MWLVITWWPLVNCGALSQSLFLLETQRWTAKTPPVLTSYCAKTTTWVLLILIISHGPMRNKTLCAHFKKMLENPKSTEKSYMLFLCSPCSLMTYFKICMLAYMCFICEHLCLCVWRPKGYGRNTFFLCDKVSHRPGGHQVDSVGWLASPREHPLSPPYYCYCMCTGPLLQSTWLQSHWGSHLNTNAYNVSQLSVYVGYVYVMIKHHAEKQFGEERAYLIF